MEPLAETGKRNPTIVEVLETWFFETDHISQDVVNQHFIYNKDNSTDLFEGGLGFRTSKGELGT